MKKIIAVLVMIHALTVQADPAVKPQYKPVYCAPFAELLQALSGSPYYELPVWAAKDGKDTSRYVLFINDKNKNWTLVQVWNSIGCVLGAGTDGQSMNGRPSI